MSELKPERLIGGLMFPEGPRWWDEQLWFSDVYGLRVYRMEADGSNLETVAELPDWPSGLGELPDGRRIVVEMRSQKLWEIGSDGELSVFADLSGIAVNELNDLVTDRKGRSYSGCYGFDILAGAQPKPGSVLLTEPDGSTRIVGGGVMFPNGMAVTEDGSTLLVAQTLGAEITAFDIEEDGSLTNQRPWAKMPDTNPDGICLDAEGALWVASVFTGDFFRVEEGGAVTEHIDVSPRWGLAPMLAGKDRRTLYLLTTETDMDRLKALDMEGAIDAVTVDIPGAGLP